MKASKEIGKCANCNSDNIEYGNSGMIDESMYYEYDCNDCDEVGKEWYNLTYVETISY
jgi:hypothetical protein